MVVPVVVLAGIHGGGLHLFLIRNTGVANIQLTTGLMIKQFFTIWGDAKAWICL